MLKCNIPKQPTTPNAVSDVPCRNAASYTQEQNIPLPPEQGQ